MGNSVRLRTELGINKTLNVELEQNFNSLEILSLKIQQEDLYNQSCSQYGVVVGRVIANGGYGVPNTRISVFIPITNEDKGNPEILAIYPYTNPQDRNEDGYRYNLLPYEQSYSNHVPTGTFPSRKDALTDRLAIEIYDKYYKYVVKTNESGDFMIMGVPLGVQTVFMDLDLSDMGEFSLTPQDLIRMGRATEAQIAGRQFKSSTDLNSLPQIVSITKSIDVSPLWGDPSTCQIAVNRVDFDLRDEANIDIQPTSVFMGSMVSSIENKPVRVACKPATEMGNLCNLVAGPGEILAIRQTIYQDAYGRPILEQYNFDGGNDVIDTEGVWMADLPMNLDYISINEFGERIISNDPKVGIPTKGKYRFKIKWKQPNDLAQPVKRGYYLVPNIRENGWGNSSSNDPRKSTGAAYSQFVKSYAFSLDWNDYGDTGTTIGNKIIQTAIDCEDRFYEFNYNKVYTVSNLIDLYHKGWANGRFIGIKQITDTNCDSTNYKFPTNDGVKNFDFLFAITNFILTIYTITIISFIPTLHVLCILFPVIKAIFVFVYFFLQYLIYGLCRIIKLIKWSTKCNKPKSIGDVWNKFPKNPFVNFSLPIITYPECEMCSCKQETIDGENSEALTAANTAAANNPVSCNVNVADSVGYSNYNQQEYCNDDPFINGNSASCNIITSTCEDGVFILQELMAGNNLSDFWKRTPATVFGTCNGVATNLHSQDLTLAERLNLFNTKGKYFDSLSSQGGGWNQIKVKIRPDLNPSPQKFHHDNVMVMMIDSSCADQFSTGKLISFNNPAESGDNNLTGYSETTYIDANGDEFTTTAAIGTPTSLSQINLTYANPTNPSAGVSVSYVVDQTAEIINAEVPNTQGIITGFTYEGGGGTLVDNTYNNVGGVSNTNGSGATFDITISSGLITTVILNNAGVGYYEGDTISFFDTQFGGVDNEIVLVVNVSGVTTQQYTQNIIQKFPTDIEYFQVLTSMTYSQFCSLNPTVPTGQYNNSLIPNFNSLRYRYIDNFMTFFTEITNTTFIPLIGPINTFQYVSQYNTLRPIFAMPEQKDFLVTFLVRGVDPHSARQTMEVDISRLMGQNYGNIKITGNYKLNIPIQPELKIPRHNLITTNQTVTPQGGIFFDSFLYSTSSTFRSFNTNLISNYSSLDSTQLNVFQVNNTTTTTLDTNKISVTNGYVSVNNSTNAFGGGSYSLISNNSGLVNSAAYNSTNNPTHNLDLLSTGINKQHRGYYNNEYVEGGAYFYMNPTEVQRINIPTGFGGFQILSIDRILPQSFIYFSPVYSSGITTQFLTGTKKIVMRTDRLPSSSYRDDKQNNNIFILNQNQGFSVYSYDDAGNANNESLNISQGYSSGLSGPQDFESQFEQSVVSTFNCANLAPLGCYSGNGESFGVKPIGDSCYDKAPVKGGCYVFVSPPLLSLIRDMTTQIGEWKTRFRVNLGACRGVFGHSFNNNWVNGTLFAFPIKNKRLFDSNNKPFNKYCKDIAMLHPTTNNFFYRSSPYNAQADNFVGMTPPNPTHRNKVQLLYPTTIMDLGPRDDFASELILSENYFGYVMDKFEQTTYQDVSDILNLFIISRQVSANFWEKVLGLGDASINGFFSRRGYLPLLPGRFDGDYTQSISINSEIGVDEFGFDSYSYSTGSTGNNSFYVNNNIFGIFFSSDTQTRDYLTPRRIIRNDLINPGIYDYLPVKSQIVPMYKWKIENSNTIFGTEKNEWATNQGDIQKFNYQSLDRINTVSNYFMGQTNIPEFFKGYIFNVKPATPPNTGYVFEGDRTGPMTNQSGSYTVGAPFYFYFGLVRGANAIDKFKKKYLGVETI